MNNLTKKRKKKGFTLVELMAVVAIIAILAVVLVPTVTGYIERAKKTAVISQARTVVSAVELLRIVNQFQQQLQKQENFKLKTQIN